MEGGRRPGKEHVDPSLQRTASSRRSQSRQASSHQEDLREELERKKSNDPATMTGSTHGRELVATPQSTPFTVNMTAEMAEAMEAMLRAYHAPTAGVVGVPTTHHTPIAHDSAVHAPLVAHHIPNPSQGREPSKQQEGDGRPLNAEEARLERGPANKNPQPKGSVFSRLSESRRSRNRNPLNQPPLRQAINLEEGQGESRARNTPRAPQHSLSRETLEDTIQSPNRRARKEKQRMAKLAAENATNPLIVRFYI